MFPSYTRGNKNSVRKATGEGLYQKITVRKDGEEILKHAYILTFNIFIIPKLKLDTISKR